MQFMWLSKAFPELDSPVSDAWLYAPVPGIVSQHSIVQWWSLATNPLLPKQCGSRQGKTELLGRTCICDTCIHTIWELYMRCYCCFSPWPERMRVRERSVLAFSLWLLSRCPQSGGSEHCCWLGFLFGVPVWGCARLCSLNITWIAAVITR